jgi:tetratricopeptide (TPR) repeat protein
MRSLCFVSLLSLACGVIPASAQTPDATNPAPASVQAPATTNAAPAPAPPKPHIVDVPQPNQDQVTLPAPVPPSGPPLDAAQVAAYQKRFEDGYALQQAGKLAEARAIYEGILAEQPDAKRSLLEAGRISLKLNDLAKADAYLSRLHALVPDFPEAIELLIQVNQALKRDIKVALLIKQFQTLHASAPVPGFGASLNFVREQIRLDSGDVIVFTQYFDYTRDPNYVWQAQVLSAEGTVKRELNLFYDAKAAKDLEQKDPKLADAAQFILVENVLKDGQIARVDAYFQMFSMPEYAKVRNTMLKILAGAYKPVYSQNIGAPAQ